FVYGLIAWAVRTLGDDGSAAAAAEEGIKYPVFASPLGHSWIAVFLSLISACIWAPFFEEIFCRGGLHRYLPSKLGIMGRVAISAVIFGSIHPYDLSGIIPVTLSGVIFGLLREWRGSLIAGMVAHCLHNATIELSDAIP